MCTSWLYRILRLPAEVLVSESAREELLTANGALWVSPGEASNASLAP